MERETQLGVFVSKLKVVIGRWNGPFEDRVLQLLAVGRWLHPKRVLHALHEIFFSCALERLVQNPALD